MIVHFLAFFGNDQQKVSKVSNKNAYPASVVYFWEGMYREETMDLKLSGIALNRNQKPHRKKEIHNSSECGIWADLGRFQ